MVNVAARVCEAAKGGQVLVTSEVLESTGGLDGIRVGRVRARRMKGVKAPVHVCDVRPADPPS